MAITKTAEFVAAMPDASQLLSEEPEMETSLHFAQLAFLVAILEWLWRDRQDFFIGANLSIYFSRRDRPQDQVRTLPESLRDKRIFLVFSGGAGVRRIQTG